MQIHFLSVMTDVSGHIQAGQKQQVSVILRTLSNFCHSLDKEKKEEEGEKEEMEEEEVGKRKQRGRGEGKREGGKEGGKARGREKTKVRRPRRAVFCTH